MKIVEKKTADLIPYARNARRHSDAQVSQIAGSIREFGFNNPVLIDGENGIIAGHGRVLAAQKLGLEKVPTIELEHLTPTQKKAYILADNRLAETGGGWDEEMLLEEIEEIGAELAEQAGFTQEETEEISKILSGGDMDYTSVFFEPEEKKKKEKTCPHCGKKI